MGSDYRYTVVDSEFNVTVSFFVLHKKIYIVELNKIVKLVIQPEKIPYLPMYKLILCISRPPILEPKIVEILISG